MIEGIHGTLDVTESSEEQAGASSSSLYP